MAAVSLEEAKAYETQVSDHLARVRHNIQLLQQTMNTHGERVENLLAKMSEPTPSETQRWTMERNLRLEARQWQIDKAVLAKLRRLENVDEKKLAIASRGMIPSESELAALLVPGPEEEILAEPMQPSREEIELQKEVKQLEESLIRESRFMQSMQLKAEQQSREAQRLLAESKTITTMLAGTNSAHARRKAELSEKQQLLSQLVSVREQQKPQAEMEMKQLLSEIVASRQQQRPPTLTADGFVRFRSRREFASPYRYRYTSARSSPRFRRW